MAPTPKLRLARPLPDLVAGGPVEFEELFTRYVQYVARLAARMLGSGDEEVDDVVQDVFWLASRRLPQIADMIQARGWLATVTTPGGRRPPPPRHLRRFFHASPHRHDVPAPGATAEQRALLTRLYEILARLPTEQRLPWSLRYLEGEPLDAVAVRCGCRPRS